MKKINLRLLSFGCAFLGVALILYVLFPILLYEITSPRLASYISPIPEKDILAVGDLTKASNWFAGTVKESFDAPNIYNYTITIPSLNIKKATVAIGGEDLSQSLIQYPGTAVPGKPGNAVIFGHSILPQFFNPKDYLSIFSLLPTLRAGDEIFIDYDGISFVYKVEDKFEVLPTDLQILEQNPSDSFLTLVTCTPPGHPLRPKRLIVRARVMPPV